MRKEAGKPFREVLQTNPNRLITLAFGQIQGVPARPPSPTGSSKSEVHANLPYFLLGHRDLIPEIPC